MSAPAPRGRRWGYGVLAGYLLAMATLVLWPDGSSVGSLNIAVHDTLARAGAPAVMTPARWEVVFNVLIAMPPTAAAMLLWPRSRWVRG